MIFVNIWNYGVISWKLDIILIIIIILILIKVQI